MNSTNKSITEQLVSCAQNKDGVAIVQLLGTVTYNHDRRNIAGEAFELAKSKQEISKVNVALLRTLALFPSDVWNEFPNVSKDIKEAEQLIKLAQAFDLCEKHKVGYFYGRKDAGCYVHPDMLIDKNWSLNIDIIGK